MLKLFADPIGRGIQVALQRDARADAHGEQVKSLRAATEAVRERLATLEQTVGLKQAGSTG